MPFSDNTSDLIHHTSVNPSVQVVLCKNTLTFTADLQGESGDFNVTQQSNAARYSKNTCAQANRQ